MLAVLRFAVLALVPAVCLALPTGRAAAQPFSFGVFGDTAYAPSREAQLERVIAGIDRARLAFVVHVGDLGSPRAGACSDELWARRLAQFKAIAHPTIYTPGDNEWTDCHDAQGFKGGNPLERLAKLRTVFFASDRSFGRKSIPLAHQDGSADPRFAKYRENKLWQLRGLTFATLHVVGSNNNRGRTPENDAEWAERSAADVAWLRAVFARAKASGSKAVVIFQQANMLVDLPPVPGDNTKEPSGFTATVDALVAEARAFARPVLLINGDSHFFRMDKPFMVRQAKAKPVVPNITRVEGFGDPFHHWVEVRVSPAEPDLFAVRPRMIRENMAAGE